MQQIKQIRNSARKIILEEGAFLAGEAAAFGDKTGNNPAQGRDKDKVKSKSSFKDLVTYLDIEVENRLKEKLSVILPGSQFLAEETDKSLKNAADKLWIIDPIDGTTNFVHQFPFYCISVALQLEGELVLGFVYSPPLNEFYEAVKGEGSFLNDCPITVSDTDSIQRSLLATGFAYNFSGTEHNNLNYFHYFQANSQGVRRLGSAALDICNVAKGTFDGFWELFLNPWDVAAGILLVKEAGGIVSTFSGEPYRFGDNTIITSNARLHHRLVEAIASL